MRRWTLLLLGLSNLFLVAVNAQDWKDRSENADYIHRSIKQVTDVMVHDIYSPPVTSRTYAYISVAAYETMIQDKPDYFSLSGQLHGLLPLPVAAYDKDISLTIAAAHAVLSVGKALVISEEKIDKF